MKKKVPIPGLRGIMECRYEFLAGKNTNEHQQTVEYRNHLGDVVYVEVRSEVEDGARYLRGPDRDTLVKNGTVWRHFGNTKHLDSSWTPDPPAMAEIKCEDAPPQVIITVICKTRSPFTPTYEGKG